MKFSAEGREELQWTSRAQHALSACVQSVSPTHSKYWVRTMAAAAARMSCGEAALVGLLVVVVCFGPPAQRTRVCSRRLSTRLCVRAGYRCCAHAARVRAALLRRRMPDPVGRAIRDHQRPNCGQASQRQGRRRRCARSPPPPLPYPPPPPPPPLPPPPPDHQRLTARPAAWSVWPCRCCGRGSSVMCPPCSARSARYI
jgi:hypothetical protein